MGQTYPVKRCKRCGTLMTMMEPPDGGGPRVLRCIACEKIDPLELARPWLYGELQPPK